MYLSTKHNDLLAKKLAPGTYHKTLSLFIVDAFAVQITDTQVNFTYTFSFSVHLSTSRSFDC